MKRIIAFFFTGLAFNAFSQDLSQYDNLQNWRPNDQRGLNVFEDPKTDIPYEGMRVRVGGDFSMQFQALGQTNLATRDSAAAAYFTSDDYRLDELGSNFNLPTANLNLDVQFHDGVRMHLRTYLSARHHAEAWVKGGHLQIDKLDFIQEGFASGLMELVTFRVGLDEINYGDAHFRRTDNGRAIFNPFVGNYLMDAFTTEAFGEVLFRKSGVIALAAISNGKLNQSVIKNGKVNAPVAYFKLGYDDQISDDLRVRVTGSGYLSGGSYDNGTYLYGGDRGGSRYYKIFSPVGNDFEGRFNPRFRSYNAFQGALFTKFKGLEFFGFYETVMGSSVEDVRMDGQFNQLAAEVIYRFGANEDFYVASRYNMVTGYDYEANNSISLPKADDKEVHRLNVGGGWYMTKNIMTKVEYVQQRYFGEGWEGTVYQGASFDGVVVEAAISF